MEKLSVEKIDENVVKGFEKVNTTLEELNNKADSLSSGIQGSLEPSSPKPVNKGQYVLTTEGEYVNIKNKEGETIKITEEDLKSSIIYAVYNGEYFVISKVPINIGRGEKNGVAPLDENRKVPVENLTFGEVKDGEDNVVSGDEVNEELKHYMGKDTYLEKIRSTVNLFDKRAVINNKYIQDSTGNLIGSTTPAFIVSDYIFVSKGVEYSISGWYFNESLQRISFFNNRGETTAQKIFKGNVFTPEDDCYVVFTVSNTTANHINTLQIQKGDVTPYEPYSDEFEEKIKEQYLPELSMYKDVTNELNMLKGAKLELGDLDDNGVFNNNDLGGVVATINRGESTFIFVKGLGNGDIKRNYFFYDSENNLLTYNYKYFYGSEHTILPLVAWSYMKIQIKDKSETNDLKQASISLLRDYTANGNSSKVIDITKNKKYNVDKFIDRNNLVNNSLSVNFTVNSDKEVKNALVPVFLHKGTRPSGATITERHIYLGDNVQNDFSDVVFSKNGRVLRNKMHSGNYSLVPYNSFTNRMFQDKTDGYILGGSNYTGVFKSTDDGKTWTRIMNEGYICMMLNNGDILYQMGKEIKLATKSSNFQTTSVSYTSPYNSFTVGQSNFCQLDSGEVFFGTYQNDFDTKIYKSIDGGKSFTQVYSSIYKQHVHKIWTFNGVVYANIDGVTNVFEGDKVPQNRGMVTVFSTDKGSTWQKVKYNWTTDYGVNMYNDGYFYGSAESNVKYSPSLFRSKDLVNWESIIEVPANTQSVRSFENNLVISTVAYGSFNYAKTFLSKNGIDMLPIFDTKNMNSASMSTALRLGTQVTHNNHFVSEDGSKWIAMCSSVSELDNYKLMIGGDNYQALCYIECDLEVGENEISIKNGIFDKEPKKSFLTNYTLSVEFDKNKTITSNAINILHDECILNNGRYFGFDYPYENRDEKSVNFNKGLTLNAELKNIKSINFGYKANKYNDANTSVSIFSTDTLDFVRRDRAIVVINESEEYVLDGAFRVYYDNTPMDYSVVFDGSEVKLYVNGFMIAKTLCNIQNVNSKTIHIQNNKFKKSLDFISNIYFFDRELSQDETLFNFQGFNLV